MYTKLFFTREYILPRYICLQISHQYVFKNRLFQLSGGTSCLNIHNINLTGHRKIACFLRLLVFLEIWVIAPFWHWRFQDFSKGCCHHDLKAFSETGYNSVLLIIGTSFIKIWYSHPVILNNNFVFCMMSSFCSMARVAAGWIVAREIM